MIKFPFLSVRRAGPRWLLAAIVGSLTACSVAPVLEEPSQTGPLATPPVEAVTPLPPVIMQAKSRWVPVPWSELPGLEQDAVHEAWPAWVQSCTRPSPPWAALCPEVRQLAQASVQTQRQWLRAKLQPYRVESHEGQHLGKLTSYYEPRLVGARVKSRDFNVPLYSPPVGIKKGTPWFSREEIATSPKALASLKGKEILYLSNQIDAVDLHIQGSGLVSVIESNGREKLVRLAFAASNEHPYKSIGTWLLQQRLLKDVSSQGIKNWLRENPNRVNELIWKNPRFIFFKEETLPVGLPPPQPKGAQNVPLTPMRSIAVDPGSIPYGSPVWLRSSGQKTTLDLLVLAQDTGSAITGPVRADYYAGSGKEAGDFAGKINQPLQLWVLWPR